MKVYDEGGRLLAHVDEFGVVHGNGRRVRLTLEVAGADDLQDLPSCTNAYCAECIHLRLMPSAISAQPDKETPMSDNSNATDSGPTSLPARAPQTPAPDLRHGDPAKPVVPVQQTTPSKIAEQVTSQKVAQVMHDIGGITPDKH